MSHFAVLVIGPDIEAQLQPYHEFECTDTNDQYVQTLDVTSERRAEYETSMRTMLRSTDGSLHSPHDEAFKVAKVKAHPFDRDYEYVTPPWMEPERVPVRELQSFAEYCREYYSEETILGVGDQPDMTGQQRFGWLRLGIDGEVIECVRRTNPNAKWDWWQIGGRWTGYFKLKASKEHALASVFGVGEPGLMTAPALPGYVDSAPKGAIDFASMRAEAGDEAGARWDKLHALLAGRTVESWDACRDRHTVGITERTPEFYAAVQQARDAYNAQPVVQDIGRSDDDDLRGFAFDGMDRYLLSREAVVQRARDGALSTYAVVKDGVWYGKGDMGWWGMTSNEVDPAEWEAQFAALLDGLPDDTRLTVVDCHI